MNSSIRNDVKEIIARVKELDTRPDKEERALKQELLHSSGLTRFLELRRVPRRKEQKLFALRRSLNCSEWM